jgi:small conductance mechanosensitive channel
MMNQVQEYLYWVLQNIIDKSPNLIAAILILIIGWILAVCVKKLIFKVIEKTYIPKTPAIFITHIIYVILLYFIIVSAMSKAGVPTTSLSNLIVGRNTSGSVESIELFFTKLRTSDGRQVVVPNNIPMTRAMTNFSNNEFRRNDFLIGIGYGDSIIQAKEILQKIIDEDGRIFKNISGKESIIKTDNLGADSVNLLVRYWTTRADFANVRWDLTENAKLAFDENKINIPYPQRDLHIHQV